jgi:hypothetical protein
MDLTRPAKMGIVAMLVGFAAAALLVEASETGTGTSADGAMPRTVTLRHNSRLILESVAQRLGVTLRPEIPEPAIYFESITPLRQFQDAIAAQWGFRPHAFANAYVVARNEIYLIDDPVMYARLGHTLDESLAHEFAHYLQVRYFEADLADPVCETDAVAVQLWFRDAIVAPSRKLVERHERDPRRERPL